LTISCFVFINHQKQIKMRKILYYFYLLHVTYKFSRSFKQWKTDMIPIRQFWKNWGKCRFVYIPGQPIYCIAKK
jgi:hypothetical protein